ncbi:hypothetical protein [Streptomyces akebiae]|uniref:Uncharacterized protein n=1 Tax=Streptomyces akebiae TaxID=2865673 RepID=A0ABX8Y450_9ACTN|nr:hypothetical protein [Streptomyces akebiae]QYX82650.1 hypothetical protein K1J60_44345 [Streptomyces akebiae]
MSINVEHAVLARSEFRRVDLGFPTGHWVLVFASVQGDFGAFVGDAEVGVLDVDGDNLARVGASDAKALAGHHHDAVGRDLAFDTDGGRGRRKPRRGDTSADEPRALSLANGEGKVLARRPSCT